jgi:hypothetical protein
MPWAELPPEPPQHAFFVEIGGAALAYSLNYEYRPIPDFGMRIGASVIPLCIFGSCELLIGSPVTLGTYFGTGSHHMELGGGATVFLGDDDARFAYPQAGYRYEPADGGFVFRAMFSVLVRINKPKDVLPWLGLSTGYSF